MKTQKQRQHKTKWTVKKLPNGEIKRFNSLESAKIEALYLYDRGVFATIIPPIYLED